MSNRDRTMQLTDGRRVRIRVIDETVQLVVEGTTVLVVSRPDAWALAETLDAVASGA